MLTQICAGSDNGPPRQSCQLGRSSRSRRNLHCKVQRLFNQKKVYKNFLIMQVLQCPKIYLFNHEHFQHQEWMSENLIFLMTKMFITTGDPPGLGWVEGPWVRETRVRRKMLRNCRGSSGFSFFKRFSFFFTRFFGFLFKRFFRFPFSSFPKKPFLLRKLKRILLDITSLRSHSFRLRTLHEEDVFSVGKVFFPPMMRFKFWQFFPLNNSLQFLAVFPPQ